MVGISSAISSGGSSGSWREKQNNSMFLRLIRMVILLMIAAYLAIFAMPILMSNRAHFKPAAQAAALGGSANRTPPLP